MIELIRAINYRARYQLAMAQQRIRAKNGRHYRKDTKATRALFLLIGSV